MNFRFGSVLLLAVVSAGLLAACGSSEPAVTPTETPRPSPGPTATLAPTTPTPEATATAITATPSATAIPAALVNSVDLIELSCVDFYPGVFNPDGPNHWFNVIGSFVNGGDVTATVLANFQILDASSNVLFEAAIETRDVDPGETVSLSQSYAVDPFGGQSSCRVSFTVEGDFADVEKFAVAELESIYAP